VSNKVANKVRWAFGVAGRALFLGAALVTAPALAEDRSFSGPEALEIGAKLACGTTEAGVVRYGYWEGKLYSRVPGERDRHLFNVIGMNVRQCSRLVDATRGAGYRSVSREVMAYLDPKTGEVLDQWTNPWSGKAVEVMHVNNDPVNAREPTFVLDRTGKPYQVELRQYEDMVVQSIEVPLFYTNPLAGDYQDYVGGQYHAMEIFNTFYKTKEMLDPRAKRIADSRISWQRISKWLPWMQMGERDGLMVFNATGFSTFDAGKVPARLWALVDARWPTYRSPPPVDDARPNATTWSVFKQKTDAQRAQGKMP
jgi:hypothetical protein